MAAKLLLVVDNRIGSKLGKKRKPTTIVCEATGGEQNEFVRRLIKAHLPIHTANPARIKHDIASLGTKAKTDKSDARYIAQYALERQPKPSKNRGETQGGDAASSQTVESGN